MRRCLALLVLPLVACTDSASRNSRALVCDSAGIRIVENTTPRGVCIEEQNPSHIHSLQYVTDAAVVGDDLWLLLNTTDEDSGLLLVLSADDAAVRRRLTFPGLPNTGYFAVDQSRRRLYMAPRGEASVLIFELPSL